METVNMHYAKTHLSRLVEKAAKGEAFIIARAGKPLVKVVPIEEAPTTTSKRPLGTMRGAFTVPDDFDTMMEKEIEEMFYGPDDDDKPE